MQESSFQLPQEPPPLVRYDYLPPVTLFELTFVVGNNTKRCKILTGENIDKFDEFPAIRQAQQCIYSQMPQVVTDGALTGLPSSLDTRQQSMDITWKLTLSLISR